MSNLDSQFSIAEKEVLRLREVATQINALRSPAPNTRAAAARRLGDLQDGVDALLNALHDPSEIVRSAAAMALGSFTGDPRNQDIGEFLLAAIDDESERVCQSAIRSLGMLQVDHARDEIENFLTDTNPYILGASILALARLKAHDLADQLVSHIHHESPYVQMQAARAAAILRYTAAGPDIVELLKKTRASRHAAGFADPTVSRDRQGNDLYNLQNQLIRTIGELRLIDAAPVLLDTARKDIGFRGLAIEALVMMNAEIDPQLLSRLLEDPGINLRKRLLSLFAQHNYRPALPLLRPHLNDENYIIRIAALQALTQMHDLEVLPRIEWLCSHDPNPFLRVQAVQSLAELCGKAALPKILALSGDANFQVRRTTIAFLLEWKELDEYTFRALAQFAGDFPEDPLSPAVLDFLKEHAVDPHNFSSTQSEPTALVPDNVKNQLPGLLKILEEWKSGLEEPAGKERQAVQSALGFLLDILRKEK